ncbi:MAG: right-handed parallel beta-helix repeat-containing protein [Dysgonamonadaceae bacterium]|jgi:hypothetical protein|nr:right-handed parallel beta-helix repeat-containing protein [Dysgonamonadaceae bacterium]
MSPKFSLLAISVLLLCLNVQGNTNYYISASTGNDANNGLSPETAWKSLEKVNAQVFQPGDSILFHAGDKWCGQLRPQGSGVAGNPICIEKYGGTDLPIIDSEDRPGAVFQLENQEYWEVAGLEVTASATTDDLKIEKSILQGIHIIATTADRVLKHIVVRNCVVRHIYSQMKVYEGGGIWVGVPGWSDKPEGKKGVENPYGFPANLKTGFEDVLIENNRICGVDRCGILVWTTANPSPSIQGFFLQGLIPSKNVVVRGNELSDIGGDAILIMGSDAPLVERNIVRRACKKAGHPALEEKAYWAYCAASVWFHHCYKGIIQYNEVYDTERLDRNFDGMAYDIDMVCEQCAVQYNYSRNNRGGMLLIMGLTAGNVVRYNISENDHTHILFIVGNVSENNLVYNNTIYTDADTACIVPHARLKNNIFMATGAGKIEIREWKHPVYSEWIPENGELLNNCYFGNVEVPEQDSMKITADPQISFPGKTFDNIANLLNYELKTSSPCLNAGLMIHNHGGIDILGNPIPSNRLPALGAVQGVVE